MSSLQDTNRGDLVEDELEEEGDQYIDPNDVFAEISDDGDQAMDEDDEGEDGADDGPNMDDIVFEDNSTRHFPDHNGSVFAIATHPTQPIAASGGEDDLGYLWNITDGELITKLGGHTDSVSCTAFSSDGEYVSTGGMDGKVRVWRRVGKENWKTWEFLTELQGPDEVMWLRWHPRGSILLAGSNDSTVWLWQLPSGNTMQVFASHTGPVQCGDFTPDGKRIVTACADGILVYWDPRSPTPVFKLSPSDARFDLGGITSLAINSTSGVVAVGGVSGGVRIISLGKGEIVSALDGHSEGASVEAVQFLDLAGVGAGSGVLATGATDGRVCVWDLSTSRLRATLTHEDAVTLILGHPAPKNHLITTGSADKTLKTWDARTGSLIRHHKGHQGPILGASLAQSGSVVVSAGDDGVCLVFATE